MLTILADSMMIATMQRRSPAREQRERDTVRRWDAPAHWVAKDDRRGR
jgi:hypothetical protein